MTSAFELRAQEVVYRDHILGLRIDTVAGEDRQTLSRRVVEYVPASAVVAVDESSRRVLLVRQYRHPIRRYLWDLPGGMIGEDETPADCAVRELREETGLAVQRLEPLGRFHPEPAFTDHRIDLFKGMVSPDTASGARPEPELDRSAWFEPEDARRMIGTGEISSSWTLIGLDRAGMLEGG